PRWLHAQSVFFGDLGGSSSCSLVQVSLGQGLQAPDDALHQPRLVAHPRLFSEHLSVLGPQIVHGHGLERFHLLGHVHVHTFPLSRRTRNAKPTVTLSLTSAPTSRPAWRNSKDSWLEKNLSKSEKSQRN